MSPNNQNNNNMPSGINIMGMGGTGEELNQPSKSKMPKTSAKQLMKENAQGS